MIQIAAIGADAIEFISGWWPAMVGTTVLATMPITRLCEMNPDDPGSPTIDMVWADLAAGLIPSVQSPTGTLGWWVWNKASYALFQRYCRCTDTGLYPPAPIVPVPPSGVEPYPPGQDNRPQLDRIEVNLQAGSDGQTLLYQGMQAVASHTSDLYSWQTPSATWDSDLPVITMQGEGTYKFEQFNPSGYAQWVDVAGIRTHVVSLPTVYKRRGTLNPRYYGIGSIYWDARPWINFPQYNARRESIHYLEQLLAAPREWLPYGVSWYLQPGAVIEMQQIRRQPMGPSIPFGDPVPDAFRRFSELNLPGSFTDPPLWPPASSASSAIERAAPYRIASPP